MVEKYTRRRQLGTEVASETLVLPQERRATLQQAHSVASESLLLFYITFGDDQLAVVHPREPRASAVFSCIFGLHYSSLTLWAQTCLLRSATLLTPDAR